MNLSMGSHSFDVNRWIQCFEQLGVINGWQFFKKKTAKHRGITFRT